MFSAFRSKANPVAQEAAIRQRAFVKHLYNVKNPKTFGNGTQSAKSAGYSGDGDTLAVTAHRLLRNNKVLRLVKKHVETILTSDEVLQKLSSIANSPVEDAKPSDVIKTLELLAKHHKLLTEKVETNDTTERDPVELYRTAVNRAFKDMPGYQEMTTEEAKEIMQQAMTKRKLKAVS